MTVALVYDKSVVEFQVNGLVVHRSPHRVRGHEIATTVWIGGRPGLDTGFTGSIDDVKVWRSNPHAINVDFTQRPVDDGVERCWAAWGDSFRVFLEENRECAPVVNDLVNQAVYSVLNDAGTPDDAAAARWQAAAARYADLWVHNRLDEIAPVLRDLIVDLRTSGLDPAENPDVQALLGDKCFQGMVGTFPPLDCDEDFTRMLKTATELLG